MSAATLGAGMVGLVAGGWLAVPVRRSIASAQLDVAGAPRVAGERAWRPSTLVMPVLLAVVCGLAFALTGWRFGWSPELPGYLYVVAAGVALFAVDIATHRLPDLVTLSSYLIGGVLLAGAALTRGEGAPLVRAFVAIAVLVGCYWLAVRPRQGGIGGWPAVPVPVRRSIAAAQLDVAGEPRVVVGERRRRSRLVMPVLLAVVCGLVFALTGWRFGWSAELPAYLYFAAAGVALSAVDIATHRLPLPSYLIGGALLAAAALTRGEGAPLVRALLAMVVLYGCYWLAALPRRGGIGGGDVKLAGVVGLYLGYLGWAEVLLGTFLAVGYGAIVGALLMAAGRAGRRTRLALGPFMIAGAFTAILLGGPIIRGYGDLLSG